LAIFLSKLKIFSSADFHSEQYPTDSEIAASSLWHAYMLGYIKGKVVADFGAGTGILGIGALLLGASKVYFVEKDIKAIEILKENLATIDSDSYEIIHGSIDEFKENIDIVLQNPPFGTKKKHADREFLVKAFESASLVFSFHKTSTLSFCQSIAKDYKFKVVERMDFEFPLKNTMKHHKSKIKRIDVSLFLFAKTNELTL
ncbi:MAG: METTL5 family protein, partial [Nanobdellota archaeon]